MDTRERALERLATEHFDVLIVGGGITGAGAFRDAARRGLRVALVEAVDFAYGTSSRSSKLVHGGLRYLENREFSLVFEAVSERRTLQNIAPHLVNPLAFLFPVYEDSKVGFNTVRAGMWLYDALALFRAPKTHKTLSTKEVSEQIPLLSTRGLKGAPLYYDCSTDDARLTLETILDGRAGGGVALNYTRVTGFCRSEDGRICGARIQDNLDRGAGEIAIQATAVINATGPWTDRTRALGSGGDPLLRPTKGVHIVVDSARLPSQWAVVHTHPTDGRVLFTIPWGDRTYIGTTDSDFHGDPGDVAATGADVDYLLDAVNHFFPSCELVRGDVIATWAGLRPLIFQEGSESAVSREHEIFVDRDGLITIAGGKLTTYRRMGAEVVSKAMQMMALLGTISDTQDPHTGREPLPGAVGWPEDDDAEKVVLEVLEACDTAIKVESARYLANRYGTLAIDIARLARDDQRLRTPLAQGRPEILAEIDWAVSRELAVTVCDFMIRRTQLYYRNLDQGLGAVDTVAERMAELLGWDDERRTKEVLAYQAEVARSRQWRSD